MCTCIIPARGGSKRIPKKNIKNFAGKPMIAWSIEAAKASGIFSKIIVSTDDDEIANISKQLGAEVPFIRPQKLSDDYATTTQVMSHACSWLQEKKIPSNEIFCIYATAPFISAHDLYKAYKIIKSSEWDYVFSVGEYSSSVYRSFKQNDSGGVEMIFPHLYQSRSQDLDIVYHDAGMFYVGKIHTWLSEKNMFSSNSFPLKIPSWRVQDIDTIDDWERAEKIARSI